MLYNIKRVKHRERKKISMQDFVYYAPTKVYFGKGRHKEVGEIIKGYGYRKIMLQYGQGSIKKNGLYDEIMDSLKKSGVSGW